MLLAHDKTEITIILFNLVYQDLSVPMVCSREGDQLEVLADFVKKKIYVRTIFQYFCLFIVIYECVIQF